MKNFTANIISALFHPLLIPLYGALMYYFYPSANMLPQMFKLVTVSLIAVFMVLLPTIWYLILSKAGVVTSLGATERNERNWLYVFTIICYVVTIGGLFLIRKIGIPTDTAVILVVTGATMSLTVTCIVNLFWKISAHATGIGGLTGATLFVTYCFYDNAIWVYCILLVCSALVITARLQLRAHTPLQLFYGYLNGLFFCGIVPFLSLNSIFFQ